MPQAATTLITEPSWILITLAVLVVISLCISIWLFFKIRKLNKTAQIFFAGRNGKTLESTILSQMQQIKKLDSEIQELYDICKKIHGLAAKGLYRVGLVRFNPFKDVGGNQSFALALLDGKKTGFVISSLYTREGTRVYAKPVQNGQSLEQYPFTDEEQQAIKNATSQKVMTS